MKRNLLILLFLSFSFNFNFANAKICEVNDGIVVTKEACYAEIDLGNGDFINGEYVDGINNGYMEFKNDGAYYIGGAKDGFYHGYGLMTLEADDAILFGTYDEGYLTDGIIKYEGFTFVTKFDVETSTPIGKAAIISDGSEFVYIGEVKNDKYNGEGIIYQVKEVEGLPVGDFLIGFWKDNLLEEDYKLTLPECEYSEETGTVISETKCFGNENYKGENYVGIFDDAELILGFIKFEAGLEVGYFDEFMLSGPGFEINSETGDYKLGRFIKGLVNGYALAYHNEDNLTFFGDSKEGDAHGFGYEIEDVSKDFYVGMWKNNLPNGYGERTVFLENEKITVKGNFLDNSINGVAEVSYGDDYYYGEWRNNKYDGYGIYIFEDGDIQQGKFEEGKLLKEMLFCYKDNLDGSKKIPSAVDAREGCGSAEEASAIDFVNWINNSYSVSTAYFSQNNWYQEFIEIRGGSEIVSSEFPICQVSNNEVLSDFKCFAKITTEDEIYEGEFLNGKREGEGILNYTSDSEYYGNSYQGQFLNDRYHGEGTYKYASGDYYEGNFRMGRFDGFGIFYYKSGEDDGDIYEGYWQNGREHGPGVYTFANGITMEDDWVEGDVEGEFLINGERVIWENDAIVYLDDIPDTPNTAGTNNNLDDDEVFSASSGSGFFIDNKGTIVTNFHVINYCNEVYVHYKGDKVRLTTISQDKVNDLAILKSGIQPIEYFSVSNEDVGLLEEIYVAGFPFGKSISSSVKVTKGVVSSLSGFDDNFAEMQIDAALQSGNSGGPIVDNYGNVVGVAVAKLDYDYAKETFGDVPQNTNFGIKSSILNTFTKSNQINLGEASATELSTRDIGTKIMNATVYLDCLMTQSRFEEAKTNKVLFKK